MPRKNLLSLHEAIVVALINQPRRMASFENITKYIDDRNLYPVRKGNISLPKQVMLRTTKSKGAYCHLFEPIGPDHIILRDTEYNRPILLSNALDAILNNDYYFYHPFAVSLRLYDEALEIILEKTLSPEKIICIITREVPGKHKSKSSGRKKFIYYTETDLNGNERISVYHINESMSALKIKLDKPNFYLAAISDNAIVNVGYFERSKGKRLVCTRKNPLLNKLKPLRFSESKKAKQYEKDFETIQQYYKMRMSLQKKILDYKKEIISDRSI